MNCTRVSFSHILSAQPCRVSGLPGGVWQWWRYTETMKALRPILLALACALPALAMAQWQWLDKDGRKVFSDRAPPADIAPNRILKQPGGKPVEAATAATAAASAASAPAAGTALGGPAAGNAPKVSGVDKELEAKKKQAETAEAAKKKAEEDVKDKARAENCTRAKEARATYDSGVRIARTNAKGEREFIDDNQRKADVSRLDAIIAKDCKV